MSVPVSVSPPVASSGQLVCLTIGSNLGSGSLRATTIPPGTPVKFTEPIKTQGSTQICLRIPHGVKMVQVAVGPVPGCSVGWVSIPVVRSP